MTTFKFDFGLDGNDNEGYDKITAATNYDPMRGFGFMNTSAITMKTRDAADGLAKDFCIPFDASFRIDLANGNYKVSLLMGDAILPTHTTMKAKPGRMMIYNQRTVVGQFVKVSFAVNVQEGALILDFSGLAPRLNAIEIEPVPQAVTLFLAGDSTVANQSEDGYPYAGWGQALSMYFKHDVAVANHSRSGRSTKSFIDEGRLDMIANELKRNDFLFIQFGHNDQKADEERHTAPFTTYIQYLQRYIDAAREKQAIPVLITSVHRRYFDDNGVLRDSHGDYLEAVRQLSEQEKIHLIDLANLSKTLYEQLGPEGTKALFLWGSPGEFVNHSAGVQDNTHFQEQGAIRIAKLVADAIREHNIWPLAMYLRES